MRLVIERAPGVNAAPRVLSPLKWALTFLLMVTGWVIFRAENLWIAWRMYEAMSSSDTWQLPELSRTSLIGLQVGTLVLAYLVLAFFGLRQSYNQPLQTKASEAAVNSDEVAADGPTSVQPCAPREAAGDPAAITRSPSGALVYQPNWPSQLPVLTTYSALLLLFAASVLKLSAQSYPPSPYFQFWARPTP